MSISLCRSSVKGAPFWGSGRTCEGGLRGWASFSMWDPLGNLVGACLPGPCEGSGDGHLSPQGPC